MKCLLLPLQLVVAIVLCSSFAKVFATDEARDVDVTLSPDAPRETVLLVSLDDGSIIKQMIRSSADLCFKKNSESATTCLTQGAPVYDPETNVIIGYEMIEDHIDLVAKSD